MTAPGSAGPADDPDPRNAADAPERGSDPGRSRSGWGGGRKAANAAEAAAGDTGNGGAAVGANVTAESEAADAAQPDAAGPGSARRRGGAGPVRLIIGGIGQTLITVGLVLLLFVVYEVWVTNIFADRKQAKVQAQLQEQWDRGEDPLDGKTKLDLPAGTQVTLPIGEGFANLYIPRLGKDFAKTIVEGVGDSQLEEGPGHYPGSAIPGQLGNFSIAGHRVGKGEPFLNLDQLKAGDPLVVETADTWFIYTVLGDDASGDPTAKDATGLAGRQIVAPSAVDVIAPDPVHPGQTATRKLITLTTCHPKYSANQRMILHGELTRQVDRAGDALPVELGGTI